ncbi:hypothetical protein EDB85DRAFT_1984442 [Lactarius pseudohatsudake]|nr:hypothetical protein EDB85DRAFT_1984442 [Lactarius pseudohatsudake]
MTGRKGATRLLQILISEAAHLIWVLRCERVIQGKQQNANETEARWFKAINRRLTEDKIAATKIKREKPFHKSNQRNLGKITNEVPGSPPQLDPQP